MPKAIPAELLAVFNITEGTSFTDAGKKFHEPDGDGYYSPVPSVNEIMHMVADGAGIIDLGAEPMCPGSVYVPANREIERLASVLPELIRTRDAKGMKFRISIDTRKPETAAWAINLGADIINDVSGLDDPAMLGLAVKHKDKQFVFMHHLGTPPLVTVTIPKNEDPVFYIMDWARRKTETFERAGVNRDQLIFDPGIAFGKTALQSLELLHRAGEFAKLGFPICYGHSRKTYYMPEENLPVQERDVVTAKLSRWLAEKGVGVLRVHNVKENRQALDGKPGYELASDWYEVARKGLIERTEKKLRAARVAEKQELRDKPRE